MPPQTATTPPGETQRLLNRPDLWNLWPFLPLVRRTGAELELGFVIDTRSLGITGFSSTVFKANVFELPLDPNALARLPREVFDSMDELIAAGWRVD
ncbi:MAG TPA: hypothetical protein VGE74_09685 [Gemmata sp.]